MTKLKVGDMVRVDWVDSLRHQDGWGTLSEARSEVKRLRNWPHHSVGFLVYTDRHVLAVALNSADDRGHGDRVSDVVSIPQGAVKRARRVK